MGGFSQVFVTPEQGAQLQIDEWMNAFRIRAKYATDHGFAAGFPNFYQATYNGTIVGGSIFLDASVAEWRDVSLVELGNPGLNDFGGRMRATNAYATKHGYVGGFPTFFHADYGKGIVCGTVLLKGPSVVWRDVPIVALENASLDDVGHRFRATQDYAKAHGFEGGFPNMFHASYELGLVCGTLLLRAPAATWRDIPLGTIPR